MVFHNEDFFNALSWTLVHSLWQGLFFAAASALLLIMARKASARLRYNILCSLLCLFVLVTITTFFLQIQISSEKIIVGHTSEQVGQVKNIFLKNMASVDFMKTVTSFIDHNVYWILVFWFGFFCLKCLRVFRQFGELHRLMNYRTGPVPEEWKNRFTVLKEQLGIRQAVAFMESQLAAVPCAAGFLRPVILIPVGLLANLPPDQIDAILLHELAHIKRRDFVINLLQTFVETLFFFNPALLWMSSIIREERENCCDDLALSISKDRPSLVRALLSISQHTSANELSAAFSGRKNSVLKRAQRILGVKNAVINQLEKSILSASILCFAIVVIACTPEHEQKTEMPTAQMEDLPKDFKAYDRELQKDMISQGIINDTVGLSYKLSKEDFIVNGQLMPVEVHQEFKSKFLRYKNITATFYNWKFEE
jgi:bla regulator protein BlaR1